ncbi:uncharacterized protein LOC119275564 [Triticum dicoccoides]|uniref:uncharacterized protein LOC119275564 n=1 Tax=Triticum dicoccoides TaxID=85692 RepID=UPI000E791592|nr:uncharacterized protein LOC119275564 [Triticum dicoccoides]
MASRFVNLAVKHMNGRHIPFSIHRINPADFFYPTGSPVPKQGSAFVPPDEIQLPPATIAFDWPSRQGQPCSMDFMAFGANRDKIVAVDSIGCSYLYDAPVRSISTNMPMMPTRMLQPMSIVVGDNGLLVMSKADHQFVALNDGCDPNSRYLLPMSGWYWQSLKPPPFPSRSYHQNEKGSHHPFEVSSYTVVGNSQFWVSTVGAGTFSFDMNSGAWMKAGNWELPFRGRAEYVPEHNLWFGMFGKDDQLCASDLIAVSAVSSPVPHILWKELVWPKDWKLRSTHLLPLGSSRLCIARFFLTSDDDKEENMSDYKRSTTNNFGVLTGVEVVSDEGGLRIIHHKSIRFDFGLSIASVL